jgi:hypothetical protein
MVHYLNGGRSFSIDESTFNRGDVLSNTKMRPWNVLLMCMNV